MARPWGLAIGAATLLGVWLGPLAIPLVALWLVTASGVRGRFDWRFGLVVIVCLALGMGRGSGVPNLDPDSALVESTGAVVRVESMPRPDADGDAVFVAVQDLEIGEEWAQSSPQVVIVHLPVGESVAKGDVLRVAWSVTMRSSLPPGYASYLSAQGASASARVWWMEVVERGPWHDRVMVSARTRITAGIQAVLPGDAGALAAGIVTGDDSGLSAEAQQAFLRTGTTHITAVSGSNVAMVLAIWTMVVPAGRLRRALVIQIAIVVTIWMYAFLVGLEPSAVRAALVASLGLFAGRAGRRPDPVTILAITAAAMALWEPAMTGRVAFWLSVVASFAISLRVRADGHSDRKSVVRGMLEGIVLAQVATLPLILAWFGTWSATSVVANALIVPLMWLAFPLCFALAGVVLAAPAIAPLVAPLPLVPLTVSLAVVDSLASVVPSVELEGVGLAALVAVTVPCMAIACGMAIDARRWSGTVARRWQEQPEVIAVTVIAPLVGILAALAIALAAA